MNIDPPDEPPTEKELRWIAEALASANGTTVQEELDAYHERAKQKEHELLIEDKDDHACGVRRCTGKPHRVFTCTCGHDVGSFFLQRHPTLVQELTDGFINEHQYHVREATTP